MTQIENLTPGHLPGSALKKGSLALKRERLVHWIYLYWLIVFSIGLPAMLISYPQTFRTVNAVGYIALYIALAALKLVRNIPYHVRAGASILALLASGAIAMFNAGLDPSAVLFLAGGVLVASLLYETRIMVLTAAAAFTIIVTCGVLVSTGAIVPPLAGAGPAAAGNWIMAGVVFLFLIFVITGPKSSAGQGLNAAPGDLVSLADRIQEQLELDRLAEERSATLAKKARLYEIASQITRELSAEISAEAILDAAAAHIHNAFGFYHVGIYINDRKNEYAVLRTAAGEASRQMLEREYHVRVGEASLVGNAAHGGTAGAARSIESQLARTRHPLLPDTKSEAALPLRTNSQVIGAIEIHSTQENPFQEEDMQVLQIIADQIANAFAKARQMEDLQQGYRELEASHSAAAQKAWASHMRNTHQKLAYRYRNAKLEPIPARAESASELLESDASLVQVIKDPAADGGSLAVLAVPIKMRNQVLGVVELQFEGAAITPGMVELIQGSVDRMAVSLENARLMEEIQIRAERERMVGDISAKVRAASDVDSVLRIAVQEIGKTLGVSEVMLQLRKES